VDPRWPQWGNIFANDWDNIGLKINQVTLYPNQNTALEWMLSTPASITIGALPTGSGKTRIMQIAANLLNHGATDGFNENVGESGPMLIISPLISLRDDQRTKWDEYNVSLRPGVTPLRCEFLTSTHDRRDEDVIRKLNSGEVDVLCCSPDILLNTNSRTNKWLECFQTMQRPFTAMVIDEAHVIGDWGASIIPTFQLLPTIKNQLMFRNPDLRLLLLSATISKEEEEELVKLFQDGMVLRKPLNGSHAIRVTKARLGLSFMVEAPRKPEVEDALRSTLINDLRSKKARIPPRWQYRHDNTAFYSGAGPPIILYTYRKAMALEIKRELKANGWSAIEYIGSSSSDHRRRALNCFRNNEVNWVVGTSAFGMGVDKDDVWVIGYYGLPSSLKDLYQSFGRAARYDDWDEDGSRKNGYCKAIIIGRQQVFSPKMKLPLTMERIMRSFLHKSSKFLPNGHLILDLENVVEPIWSTNGASALEKAEEVEGLTAEFGDHQTYQQLRMQRSDENFNQMVKDSRSRNRSRRENMSLFLWALSCAQRGGLLEVCGIHPPVLYVANNVEYTLNDSLRMEGGYSDVMKELQMQKRRDGRTPHGQKRFIVLRVKGSKLNYQILTERVQAGLKTLHERYQRGAEELSDFKNEVQKKQVCLRKLFAGCYGSTREKTKSCLEHLAKREHAMPCSVCMSSLEPGNNPVDHIWSENTHFESLFKKQWPQKPVQERKIFNRPQAQNTLPGPYNQRKTIDGPFEFASGINASDFSDKTYPLFSDDKHVANIEFTSDGNVMVESLVKPGPNWEQNGRSAFSVIYCNKRAEIKWLVP
jgi:superfamily II DNA/RNA helicase